MSALRWCAVSVLFDEPKLLNRAAERRRNQRHRRFSALRRAEIAERRWCTINRPSDEVSVLFDEPKLLNAPQSSNTASSVCFSALRRAEIAEPYRAAVRRNCASVSVLFDEPKLLNGIGVLVNLARERVSVLFDEPKLLKPVLAGAADGDAARFSALRRAEIAEAQYHLRNRRDPRFQCSSTSRNC